jgi:hydroxypyruvate reductase
MARAVLRTLGDAVAGGIVVAASATTMRPLESFEGGHPAPDSRSDAAGRAALRTAALTKTAADRQELLVLLSGGASAMMAVPADGLSLEDKRQTTERLLRAGADIHTLNTVRKHLSAIKGGRLAAAAGVCRTLAVSDVVGDDPSVIGSGPTVPDATTFGDALAVLAHFGGLAAYPPAVVQHLRAGERGEVGETPKPGDHRVLRSTFSLIGGRRDAMSGASAEALRRGYHPLVIDDAVVGEARTTAVAHARAMLARADTLARPACIVSSGETTVHVRGAGRGGRNQEFAVAAAEVLRPETAAALASAGTDGIDGPTDAAGGIVDNTTVSRARAAGIDLRGHLDDNDAYTFLDRLGDLIRTGSTGTNVGDIQVLLLS